MFLKSIPKKLHFIGIGGISMSGLAKLALYFDHEVTGSDISYGDWYTELYEAGAKVYIGSGKISAQNTDLVIYNSAIKDTDPELVSAREQGIVCVPRHLFLAAVASNYKKVIAVSGTHGKTTTTAMIAKIFKQAGLAFTAHIGGISYDFSNLAYFGNDYFITEACEYKKNFLSLKPDTGVILNVESDHPDCYSCLSELYCAFEKFGANSNNLIALGEGEYYQMRASAYNHITTFSIDNTADIKACDISEYAPQCFAFTLEDKGQKIGKINLKVRGKHNIFNALASYAVSKYYFIPFSDIKIALEDFNGIKRRFESMGTFRGAEVIVDYAHHPSEIKAVIKTAKGLNPKGLKVVFQPHTFSRTKALMPEFLTCFTGADELFILKCYSAREVESDGITAFELASRIKKETMYCSYYDNTLSLAQAIGKTVKEGEIILILGAGDVVELGSLLATDATP